MTASASSNNGRRVSWWARLLRSVGTATGVVAVAATQSVALAQDAIYRSAVAAPASWNAFAKELQSQFQGRLGSDDDASRRLREAIAGRDKQSAQALVVRAWITPNGKVERVEFDRLAADIAVNLRALLASVVVSPPPPDMLQPLHLRLSLRAGDDARKDQ
jgi:hypothetical protein